MIKLKKHELKKNKRKSQANPNKSLKPELISKTRNS